MNSNYFKSFLYIFIGNSWMSEIVDVSLQHFVTGFVWFAANSYARNMQIAEETPDSRRVSTRKTKI